MTKLVAKSAAIGALVVVGLAMSAGARADEADAKKSLKAMSDYMAKQTTISFRYDFSLEVVTKDHQKIMLANSGTTDMNRPDKIRMTRDGGFPDVEMIFDGKTLTVWHKDANIYAQADVPGTLITSSMGCGISSTSPLLALICSCPMSMTRSWTA